MGELAGEERLHVGGAELARVDAAEAGDDGLLAEERLGAKLPGAVADERSAPKRLRRRLDALRRAIEPLLGKLGLHLAETLPSGRAASGDAGIGTYPGDLLHDARRRFAELVDGVGIAERAGNEAAERAILQLEREVGRRLGGEPGDQRRCEQAPDRQLVLIGVGEQRVAAEEILTLEPHGTVLRFDHLAVGVGIGHVELAQIAVVAENANGEAEALGSLDQNQGEGAPLQIGAAFVDDVDLGEISIPDATREVAPHQARHLAHEAVPEQLSRLRQREGVLAVEEATLGRVRREGRSRPHFQGRSLLRLHGSTV